jgi:hypothetical protein
MSAGSPAHAQLLADRYRDKVESLDHVELKLGYFQGVLDAVSAVDQSRDS